MTHMAVGYILVFNYCIIALGSSRHPSLLQVSCRRPQKSPSYEKEKKKVKKKKRNEGGDRCSASAFEDPLLDFPTPGNSEILSVNLPSPSK